MSRGALIIDAGVGNLGNLARAVEHVGGRVEISADPVRVAQARCLLLPGVGAFAPPREAVRGGVEEALQADNPEREQDSDGHKPVHRPLECARTHGKIFHLHFIPREGVDDLLLRRFVHHGLGNHAALARDGHQFALDFNGGGVSGIGDFPQLRVVDILNGGQFLPEEDLRADEHQHDGERENAD